MNRINVNIRAIGAFVPGHAIGKNKHRIIEFADRCKIPKEYVKHMDETGCYPGDVWTNDFWIKQPWYDHWISKLPAKRKKDPFYGTIERRICPIDPVSVRTTVNPHRMKPTDAACLAIASVMGNCVDRNGKPLYKLSDFSLMYEHSMPSETDTPTSCCLIHEKAGFPETTFPKTISNCCASGVSALESMGHAIMSGEHERGIIVMTCCHSDFIDFSDPDVSTRWGDLAVAMIVEKSDKLGIISSGYLTHGKLHDAIGVKIREPKLASSFELSGKILRPFCTLGDTSAGAELAKKCGSDLKRVFDICKLNAKKFKGIDITKNPQAILAHQPTYWSPETWYTALGMPFDARTNTYNQTANIANCSALYNFLIAADRGVLTPGNPSLLCSSGAGENIIGMLINTGQEFIDYVKMSGPFAIESAGKNHNSVSH